MAWVAVGGEPKVALHGLGRGIGTSIIIVGVLILQALMVPDAHGQNPITLSMVPIGGTTVNGGSVVLVELFVTVNSNLSIATIGRVNLPCLLVGQPGSSGSVTALFATGNPDGMGEPGPSSEGVPILFGSGPVYAPHICALDYLPGIAGGNINLLAGDIRYLGTYFYEISECATGAFDIVFENGTFFSYSLHPIQPIPMDVQNTVLTIHHGTCCTTNICLADALNQYCCESNNPGARWVEGRTCADPVPCPDCLDDADCDDGDFCNGAEVCNPMTGACELGTPPDCDDGLFCNGVETCDAVAGCQAGAAPCTGSVPVDGATVFLECDEAADTCVVPPIPTVSTWGLISLALALLTLAKLRRIAPPGLSGR